MRLCVFVRVVCFYFSVIDLIVRISHEYTSQKSLKKNKKCLIFGTALFKGQVSSFETQSLLLRNIFVFCSVLRKPLTLKRQEIQLNCTLTCSNRKVYLTFGWHNVMCRVGGNLIKIHYV